jgi:hypothetical protein
MVLPTHKERKNDAPGRLPKWAPVADILNDASVASPKWSPWNFEMVKGIIDNHQERGDRLSTTALTGGCMRGTLLERKEDYIGSFDSYYASFRGTAMHGVLEKMARPGSLAEWRFYVTVDGLEISGSPDLITYDTVWDWKTTENPPMYNSMWSSHNLQLQFNRFMFNNASKWDAPDGQDPKHPALDPHATRIQHLAIVYLGPKGPKVLEAEKKGPTRFNVPDVWTDQEVLAELRPRMEGWKMAWGSYPKWPAGLEDYPGWAGPPSWVCPGPPLCNLPGCMAKRYPNGLTWVSP